MSHPKWRFQGKKSEVILLLKKPNNSRGHKGAINQMALIPYLLVHFWTVL